jgi:hypothetical protein
MHVFRKKTSWKPVAGQLLQRTSWHFPQLRKLVKHRLDDQPSDLLDFSLAAHHKPPHGI